MRQPGRSWENKWAKRLVQGIEASEKKMKKFLTKRKSLVEKYVGDQYGNAGGTGAQPFNMIWYGTSVFIPQLVTHNPRMRVRKEDVPLSFRADAWSLQKDLNQTVRRVDMARPLREMMTDTMFLFAVSKTGMAPTPQGNELFYERVSPDNYVVDPAATSRREAMWEGDQFDMRWDVARNAFGKKADALQPEVRDPIQKDKAEAISGTEGDQSRELIPRVRLYEIYMPQDNVILTVSKDQNRILSTHKWPGPEGGPYDMLGYHYVPDQLVPLPPAFIWDDLNQIINTVGRKIKKQAERSKTVLAYEPKAQEDAELIRKADDGDGVQVRKADAFQVLNLGGGDGGSAEFLNYMMSFYNKATGNANLLAGASSGADSATEASMLAENASARVNNMKAQARKFAGNGAQKLGYWRHHVQGVRRTVTKRLPGTQMEYEAMLDSRQINPFMTNAMEVVPYSMGVRNPEQMAQRTLQWFNNAMLPTLKLQSQQGAQVDLPKVVRQLGEQLGIRGLDEFYKAAQPKMFARQGRGGQAPAGGPPQGGRQPGENDRRPGESPASAEAEAVAEATGTRQARTESQPQPGVREELMQRMGATRRQ